MMLLFAALHESGCDAVDGSCSYRKPKTADRERESADTRCR
jgi:hypothetical protein